MIYSKDDTKAAKATEDELYCILSSASSHPMQNRAPAKKKDYHRKLCLKTWPGNHGDMI